MKRLFVLSLFVVLTAFILVSCNEADEVSATSPASGGVKYTTVMFKPLVGRAKSISQTNSTEPTSFRYKAEPLFETTDSGIDYGDTSGFESLTKNANNDYYSGAANRFVQGRWKFTVEGLVGSVVLYRGEITVILNSADQVVSIDLPETFDSEKNGTVNISVTVPVLTGNQTGVFSANLYTAEYVALASPASVNLTADYSSGVNVVGTGSVSLPEGIYILEVSYSDTGAGVGPAQTAFIVKNGMTTVVSGTIENGEYASTALALNYLKGTLGRSAVKTDGKYTFTFTPDGGVQPTSCIWFVNGTKQSSSTTQMLWDTDASGIYYITCIAIRKTGNDVVDVFSVTRTETR